MDLVSGSSDNLRESQVQPAVKFLFSRISLTFHLATHHVLSCDTSSFILNNKCLCLISQTIL